MSRIIMVKGNEILTMSLFPLEPDAVRELYAQQPVGPTAEAAPTATHRPSILAGSHTQD